METTNALRILWNGYEILHKIKITNLAYHFALKWMVEGKKMETFIMYLQDQMVWGQRGIGNQVYLHIPLEFDGLVITLLTYLTSML